MRTSLLAFLLCLLIWGLVGCGGTNRVTRYTSGNNVTCNQTYWYATSGCMPPTSWTVPSNFVLPASWYPLTLDYVYPSWWYNSSATLGIRFTSTCKDVGNCNQRTLQDGQLYETEPNTRDDSNTVYDDFRFQRMIAGINQNPQWSSYNDPELKSSGYATFNFDGKLDVVIKLLSPGHTSGQFNDYNNSPICTAYSTGYSIVSGTMYARRLLDANKNTWQTLSEATKVNFTSYLNQSGDIISFNDKNGVNNHLTAGTYALEIHNLQWNGECLYYEKNSASSYNSYCATTHMRNLDATSRNGLRYCVNLEIAVSWNKYTSDVR